VLKWAMCSIGWIVYGMFVCIEGAEERGGRLERKEGHEEWKGRDGGRRERKGEREGGKKGLWGREEKRRRIAEREKCLKE
jgi:hypothetical protein